MTNIYALWDQKLNLRNDFVSQLPADSCLINKPRQVHNAAFFGVKPTKIAAPNVVAVSENVALILGFTSQDVACAEFAELVTGNKLLATMQPFAMCYGRHQFGYWAAQRFLVVHK